VIGRTLGEDGLGVFVLALSFATIVLIPIDLGLDRGLLREVAADRSRAGPLTANVVAIKLVIFVPAIGLAFVVLSFFDYSSELRASIAILGLTTVVESMGRTAGHLFMAHERSSALTASIVAQRFVAAAFGILGLEAGLDITAVAWAYLLVGGRADHPHRGAAHAGAASRPAPLAVGRPRAHPDPDLRPAGHRLAAAVPGRRGHSLRPRHHERGRPVRRGLPDLRVDLVRHRLDQRPSSAP